MKMSALKMLCIWSVSYTHLLTTLQKEANTKLNFSADKTLSIAQKLYEGKLISYPRTGSRYISQDVFEEIPERLADLEKYSRFAGYAAGMKGKTLNSRSVNDSKVTDHHALIVKENLPGKLEADEQLSLIHIFTPGLRGQGKQSYRKYRG